MQNYSAGLAKVLNLVAGDTDLGGYANGSTVTDPTNLASSRRNLPICDQVRPLGVGDG